MYELNPYYNPENLGLTTIAELDYSDGSYQFDYRVVWKHDETGDFYTARDSGCSCPSPFEDYQKLQHLEKMNWWTDLLPEIQNVVSERNNYGGNPHIDREAYEFLGTVRSAMID